jgi:hypothetical protein
LIEPTSIQPQPSAWGWLPRCAPWADRMNSVVSFLKPLRYRWNGSASAVTPLSLRQVRVSVAVIVWAAAS